jgi:hypothetical protein
VGLKATTAGRRGHQGQLSIGDESQTVTEFDSLPHATAVVRAEDAAATFGLIRSSETRNASSYRDVHSRTFSSARLCQQRPSGLTSCRRSPA